MTSAVETCDADRRRLQWNERDMAIASAMVSSPLTTAALNIVRCDLSTNGLRIPQPWPLQAKSESSWGTTIAMAIDKGIRKAIIHSCTVGSSS